jgi:hypothetical protein
MRILLMAAEDDADLIAELVQAGRHQIILGHCGNGSGPLELALRNALPGEEVAAVSMPVVVDADAPWKPQAVLGLRGVRSLLAANVTVICALMTEPAVTLVGPQGMKPVEAKVDPMLALGLLARRLDAERSMTPGELVEELGYARPHEPSGAP